MRIRNLQVLSLGLAFSLGATTLLFASSVAHTDIESAVAVGDLEFLKSNKVGLFSTKDSESLSLLVLAASWRQRDVVDWLLEQVGQNSAYLESVDSKGNTALHYAAYYGREDIALRLLSKGAKSTSIEKSLLIELMNDVEIRDLILERGESVPSTSTGQLSIPKIKLRIEKIKIR